MVPPLSSEQYTCPRPPDRQFPTLTATNRHQLILPSSLSTTSPPLMPPPLHFLLALDTMPPPLHVFCPPPSSPPRNSSLASVISSHLAQSSLKWLRGY
eukprot:3256185-Rhodomonas_salina.1